MAPASITPTPSRVRIAVSVDWEGLTVDDETLAALADFHERLPHVPLTHFICPAYFVRRGADKAALARKIAAVVRAQDEVGVHVHAWRSLATASGVRFRSKPSFILPDLMAGPDGDLGYEVELSAYTTDEVRTIVATSKRLLTEAGLEVSPLFRAGGLQSGPHIMEAIRAEGFTTDSSSSDPRWIADDMPPGGALATRVSEQWPHIDRTSQPFLVDTSAGTVLELPFMVADWATPAEMADQVLWALSEADRTGHDVYVHFLFHQEFTEGGTKVIATLEKVAKEAGSKLLFETVSATSAAAQRQLAERGARPDSALAPKGPADEKDSRGTSR